MESWSAAEVQLRKATLSLDSSLTSSPPNTVDIVYF